MLGAARYLPPRRVAAWALILSAVAIAAQPLPDQPISLTLREGTSMAAALSPDGRTLMIDLLGSLWTLPSKGGAASSHRRVSRRASTGWAPDNAVAFRASRWRWHIYVMNADGSELRAITRALRRSRTVVVARWQPHRVFIGSIGQLRRWEVEVATGAVRQLTRHAAKISRRRTRRPMHGSPLYRNAKIAAVSGRCTRRRRGTVAGSRRRSGQRAVVESRRLEGGLQRDRVEPQRADARWTRHYGRRRRVPVPRAMDVAERSDLHGRRQDQETSDRRRIGAHEFTQRCRSRARYKRRA